MRIARILPLLALLAACSDSSAEPGADVRLDLWYGDQPQAVRSVHTGGFDIR